MFAPIAPEPEWIELINAGPDSVDLYNWTVSDPTKTVHLPHLLLEPNALVLITKDSTILRAQYPSIAAPIIQISLPALNNTGDIITVHDSSGQLSDSVNYAASWATKGSSLERFDPRMPSDSSNFVASQLPVGPTPGVPNTERRREIDVASIAMYLNNFDGTSATVELVLHNRGYQSINGISYRVGLENSMFPIAEGVTTRPIAPLADDTITFMWQNPDFGLSTLESIAEVIGDSIHRNDTLRSSIIIKVPAHAIVLNEVMVSPVTGFSQWIELANTSTSRANLEGCKLRVSGTDTIYEYILNNTTLSPVGFALICSTPPITQNVLPRLGSIDTIRTPTLYLRRDECSVVITNSDGSVIDSFWYDGTYFSVNLPTSSTGYSLERRMTDQSALERANWGSCVDPSGSTPLAINSISKPTTSAGFRMSMTPNPFSPNGDGFEDASTVVVEFASASEEVLRVRLFDESGRMRRELAKALRCVGSVSITFDGLDERGLRLPSGLYTLIADATGSSTRIGVVIAAQHR